MGSEMIVVMEPVGVGGLAFGFGGVGLRVGPFGRQSPVESFDFAVGLWSERAGAAVCDVRPECGGEDVRSVAGAVVGHHRGDGDAVFGEERPGSLPESCSGFFAFVRQR